MKKIIAKSALALAVAAVSAGAFAGTTATITKYFAQDIFGDANSSVNGSTLSSNDTLIATPVATYSISTTHALATGNVATVKFTLGGSAVFGEDLSDITKWNTSTGNAIFKFAPTVAGVVGTQYNDGVQDAVLNTDTYTIVVDSGGAIGDNTVVFKITAGSAVTDVALKSVVFEQVKVKNLAATLGAGSVANASAKVELGSEFQVVTGVDAGKTDTAVAVPILASKPVLVLGGTATNDTNRPLIQVAAAEKKFTTAVGTAAKSDYDPTGVAYINLGTLNVTRAQYDSDGNGSDDAPVNKENGLAFDYQGSDKIKVKLTSATGWSAYDNVWLTTGACSAPTGTLKANSTTNELTIDVTGQTTQQLETGYNLCAVAKTTVTIPETSAIEAKATADFFNARYMDDEATKDYGRILRNGCSVTLFNLPNVTAADQAFIRLTNVSAISGSLRATVYNEAGNKVDSDVSLTLKDSQGVALTDNKIPAHGTVVLHTNSAQSGNYLGTLLPGFGAETKGRDRIILTGAFPACEALGLVRSPAGVLTNMTSTTYSGDANQFGAQTNGTSNTKN